MFGHFEKVCLLFPEHFEQKGNRKPKVLAQDLAGDKAVDITSKVKIEGCKLTIQGEIIRKVGLMASSPGDLSAPGLVIRIM